VFHVAPPQSFALQGGVDYLGGRRSEQFAEMGLQAWADSMADERAADLVNLSSGTAIDWVPGKGWVERRKFKGLIPSDYGSM